MASIRGCPRHGKTKNNKLRKGKERKKRRRPVDLSRRII